MKRLYTADDVELNDQDFQEENNETLHYETRDEAPDDENPSPTRSFFAYVSYAIVFLFLISLCYFLYEIKIVLDDPNVPNNVYFLNENLGGTNYKNLEKTINTISKRLAQRPVYISACGQRFMVEDLSRSIDFKVNTPSIVESVSKVGNEGNLLQRIKYRMQLKTGRARAGVACKYFYNRTKLENMCAAISEQLNVSPKSATVVELENGVKKMTREVSGIRVTPEDILKQFQSELSAFNSQNFGNLNLQYEEVRPSVTTADKLKQLNSTDLLCEFETAFNTSNPSIKDNVDRASQALDGMILRPLEVFSFNKFIGQFKYKNEADAKIFNSKQMGFFPDISGGIGVFASCLYNCVLGTGIEVLERYNHTNYCEGTAYCPPGRDAQIIYGSKDFKFIVPKNSNPVIIFSEVSLNKLKISLYGQNSLNEKVSIETMEVNLTKPAEKIVKDYSMKKGETRVEQEGLPGYDVKTLKIVKINDIENYRTVISTDSYAGLPRIIRVGDDAEE